MNGSDNGHARQEYMKRALSIMLRGTKFDTITASALDVLGTVGALYMQTMFSHVHAYAEHATRTRPNMNDVARALEERRISVSQLDRYCYTESQARSQPPVEAAIVQLHTQVASALHGHGPNTTRQSDHISAFFDTRAEDLLRSLVEHHLDNAEQQRRQRLPVAAQHNSCEPAMLAGSASDQTPGRTLGTHMGDESRRASDSRAFDDDEDDDEDDDFEAPELSSIHMQPAETPEPRSPAHDLQANSRGHDDNAVLGTDTSQSEQLPNATEGKGTDQAPDAMETMLLPVAARPDHIPNQCPLFPSPHTYKQTPVYPKREQDFFRNRVHKAEQSRQAEENLQRLISGPHALQDTPSSNSGDPDSVHSPAANINPDRSNGSTPASQPSATKRLAHKRIMQLFPPANFRDMRKRSRLANFIK